MEDIDALSNLKIDISKLLKLGFNKEKDCYKYETKIMNSQFLLKIVIDKNNIIKSNIIDLNMNEEFILYNVDSATGKFIGKMREEYDNIIENIKNNCCFKCIYKSQQSNLVIEYIKEKYNDNLEFLWKNSNNAIWRNKYNNKWYAALLIIEKRKIGINEEGIVEVINLSLEPERVDKIIDNKKYFAGYHMNKKHWITIKLDNSIDIKQIYEFIDNSYKLSIKK